MNQDEFKKEVKRLSDMAWEMKRKIKECEDSVEGHDYRVNGFSKIAHPKIGNMPLGARDDVVFSSYTCTKCGQTLSPLEMKHYREDRRNKNTVKTEREQIIKEFYGTEEK